MQFAQLLQETAANDGNKLAPMSQEHARTVRACHSLLKVQRYLTMHGCHALRTSDAPCVAAEVLPMYMAMGGTIVTEVGPRA